MSLQQPIICYKLASRGRPNKMYDAIHSIEKHSHHPHYFILVTLDEDDPLSNTDSCRGWFMEHPRCIVVFGQSGTKIKAINRDMNMAIEWEWDILVNFSDDMRVILPGFDVRIVNDMKAHHPDFDGVLHYLDGNEPSTREMTLSIMGRPYYLRFNYIYHNDYDSLWPDVEATRVARNLGRYVFIPVQGVDHLHPMHGKAAMDDHYQRSESKFYSDFATFQKREAAGFPLTSVF